MHHDRLPLNRFLAAAAAALLMAVGSGSFAASGAEDLVPQTPAAFLPGGMLGIQLGGSWKQSKQNPYLHQLDCQTVKDAGDQAGAANEEEGAHEIQRL